MAAGIESCDCDIDSPPKPGPSQGDLNLDNSGDTNSAVDENGVKMVTWGFPAAVGSPAVGPVTLTSDGEQVVNMLQKSAYVAGLGLDGLTVRATVPVG
jgi:hypothetical protein